MLNILLRIIPNFKKIKMYNALECYKKIHNVDIRFNINHAEAGLINIKPYDINNSSKEYQPIAQIILNKTNKHNIYTILDNMYCNPILDNDRNDLPLKFTQPSCTWTTEDIINKFVTPEEKPDARTIVQDQKLISFLRDAFTGRYD